ncbi:MAG: ribosome maturation factor RimM [Hyphomicrobium sp.]
MSNSPNSKSRILLGTIATVHGIRGEIVVRAFTGDPAAIASYGPLSDKDDKRRFKLRVVRVTPKGVIARVEGIADRTAAETLRGIDLYVERAKLPKPADGEYYHTDLIGLDVRDPAGVKIATVANVSNFGAGDLLEVRFEGANATEYIPFTNVYVPQVDIAAGFVTVVMPELVGEEEPASEEGAEGGDDSET